METDKSMYKRFSLIYKLHQSLMKVVVTMSPFLLVKFLFKQNPPIHTHMLNAHTHTHRYGRTDTYTHAESRVTVVSTPDLATQHALHITHSREENNNKINPSIPTEMKSLHIQ